MTYHQPTPPRRHQAWRAACVLILTALPLTGILANNTPAPNKSIDKLCLQIGQALGSVSTHDCLQQALQSDQAHSTQQRPLAYKEYPPFPDRKPLGRVLIMGGIHGDEYSSVSLMFKWMNKLNQYHSGLFHWRVIPLLNPDGLLETEGKATRQNANGVDLNRNFPTPDWEQLAQNYWINRTYRNPRRYPGPEAASEPETRWFVEQVQTFRPDAIIAVHAPHHLVDFDGPHNPPHKLGGLRLRRLGTYPGSLGNYGGLLLDVPVITIELASAGIMPSDTEISRMWVDLVRWLKREVPKQHLAKMENKRNQPANKTQTPH